MKELEEKITSQHEQLLEKERQNKETEGTSCSVTLCMKLSHTVEFRAELESVKKLHQKQLEEKEKATKEAEFQKMDVLLCDLLQEKDRELQQIVTQNLDQADSPQFLKGTTNIILCALFSF